MDPRGGEGQDHVAGGHFAVVDDLALVHDTNREAGQVIVVGVHGARMLGSLAADEGTAGLDAALGHARDQSGHLFRIVLSNGDVVQEEEGSGAAADDVVDAHGHTVDTHRIVPIHQLGDALLGAHTVGARDQHGLGHAGEVGGKKSAETAQVRDHAGDKGTLHMLFHQLDALVASLDVDAGGGVGCGMRFFHKKRSRFKSKPYVGV